MLKVLLGLLLLVSTSYACEIRVNLVVVEGENGFSCEEAKSLFKDIRAVYDINDMPVTVVRKRFRCITTNTIEQTLDNRVEVFNYWYNTLEFFSRRINLVILPPIKQNNKYYLAGLASSGRNLAVANAMKFNSTGEDRYPHSIVASVHELAHAIHATHDDSEDNVMETDALSTPSHRFLRKAKRQIRWSNRC